MSSVAPQVFAKKISMPAPPSRTHTQQTVSPHERHLTTRNLYVGCAVLGENYCVPFRHCNLHLVTDL